MPNRVATFETNHGSFRVELFEARAPLTTDNFVTLVEKSYYDGLTFHRVIRGFMIQGGCPEGTGRGGPGFCIRDEFHPELRHEGEGILSMANAGPDTGGSQFFITLAETPWLNDRHAVFGRVVDGMEVVRAIGDVRTGAEDRPAEAVVIHRIRIGAADAE